MNKSTTHALEAFENRHLGPSALETSEMLNFLGVTSLDDLIEKVVPKNIRLSGDLNLPKALSEYEFITEFRKLMGQNKINKSYIGQGYYRNILPPVIQRNILENPGWYTAYTPYQAEISQGRVEMLLNFQTLICELTAMPLANAALLDEATAAAEAMNMLFASKPKEKKDANVFFISEYLFEQTKGVLYTRAEPLGIKIIEGNPEDLDLADPNLFGIMIQTPNKYGEVENRTSIVEEAKANSVQVAIATDLLALCLMTPPGEMGVDVVIGSAQRFGVPLGFGGPHAAFFATRESYKRSIPGRIIGSSIDSQGNTALRMALQTREQHIKREKATSNICTSQVLLAVISAAYALYHGPKGLKLIAQRVQSLTQNLRENLHQAGISIKNGNSFDTVTIEGIDALTLTKLAEEIDINFCYHPNGLISISLDETSTESDVVEIISLFSSALSISIPSKIEVYSTPKWENELIRESNFLQQQIFNSIHNEHQMLRYLKQLENKDVSLAHSMISLGSCTMKLNATTEMLPVTWPEVAGIHPFAPKNQVEGFSQMIVELEKWLAEITGFNAVSLQPNSGAQGEFAGLLAIRAFHFANGNFHRDIILIPSSAHGTNPASAILAGFKVVVTKCDELGNIDFSDLEAKCEQHKDALAGLMITYPSTHGVFEEGVKEICALIHNNGGQVYMDGANMNAQVGLTSPAEIGADVCHLNLHKTFCIPHGGGGPGMGPIAVKSHLAPFLSNHPVVEIAGNPQVGPVSAAPYGSASILPISYAYIAMMGADGLKKATQFAILNANYVKKILSEYYPILYTNNQGFCAHEFILDCRAFKHSCGVDVTDIAKRLMDYGFHSPTVSFPVPETLMIEPTESESKDELDRFCEALINIRNEIAEIENGNADKENNVLKNAPHTLAVITADEWKNPYSRQKAAYPLAWVKAQKIFPTVGRIDNAYGDRNLVCTCEPTEAYA